MTQRRSAGARLRAGAALVPALALATTGMVAASAGAVTAAPAPVQPVQGAAAMLHDAGARRFCVNAGGDVVTFGESEPGVPWRVGVRHPEHSDQLCVVLSLRDGAVATSASYERGDHILDGRTGEPARGLLSITVVAADLTTADAAATAAYAMGVEGIAWAAAQPGCEVFAVDSERRVFRTPGLPVAS